MRVLLVLGAALVVPRSHASFVTLAPILKDSYICLHDSANENMCVGFSPGVNTNESDTTGQTLWGQQLQMKRRDRNAAQGSDYKTLWNVDRFNGSIRSSGYSNLCIDKSTDSSTLNQVLLRPCYQAFVDPPWNLSSFLTNVNQGGAIGTRTSKTSPTPLCVTAMKCVLVTAAGSSYCKHTDASSVPMTNAQVIASSDDEYGAYLALYKCVPNLSAQYFVQALDCAPGCAPIMLINKVCDPECANDACNWDNGRCATPAPTPPTQSPTNGPSHAPTGMPSRAPGVSAPSTSPQSRAPSSSPSLSPSSALPSRSPVSRAPSASPTQSPALAAPTASPKSKTPSLSPTESPSHSHPSRSPSSFAPSSSPSQSPSNAQPSRAPTHSPTRVPSAAPTVAPSRMPSASPSRQPSSAPSWQAPSFAPTMAPSGVPSKSPSRRPTHSPSSGPSASPSSSVPTAAPTAVPSASPTASPTHPYQADSLLWLWILLGVLAGLYCVCFCIPVFYLDAKGRPVTAMLPPSSRVNSPATKTSPLRTSPSKGPALAPAANKRYFEDPQRDEPAALRRAPSSNPFETETALAPSPDTLGPAPAARAAMDDDFALPPTPVHALPPPPPPPPREEQNAGHEADEEDRSPLRNRAPRPRTGEPSLFWGGGRADPTESGASQQKRAIEKQNSARHFEEGILPEFRRELDRRNAGEARPPKRMPPPRPPPKPQPPPGPDNDNSADV